MTADWQTPLSNSTLDPVENAKRHLNHGPLPEGNAPAGLYWGMPLSIGLATVFLAASIKFFGATFWSIAPWPALLMIVGTVLAIRRRRWDRHQQQRRLLALRAMVDLASIAGPEAETEAEILRRLPQAVRAMFDMNSSYVCIVEDEGRTIRIVSSSGPEVRSDRMTISELPMTRHCLESRQVVSISNTRAADIPVNLKLADELNLRSILHIPMVVGGKAIGVLVLGDPKPRIFTELDLTRASLWGCHAAIILSNCQLYAKMSKALKDQQRIMQHRDELYTVNTAIHRPGTLEEVLQRIADMAPGPLEMDGVLVWMRDEDDPKTMVLAAATKPYDAKVVGFRLPIAKSRAEEAWTTGEPEAIEDAACDARINSYLRSLLPCDSMVIEPLLDGDGRPLGMLSLMRRGKGPFRADQLSMARLFSLRAAAAIETARLNQQTRRDADDKAMLLRELNHRVKNNLAGIVSLLSINQPDLAPRARDWLDRAVERIRAMAQTHELLSDGTQSATVAELVDRTLQSLLVAKTSGISVETDLDAGAARLRTDRAVSLAMAMHELCLNGILHGLPNGGTLTIRVRQVNEDLTVEIEDDNGGGGAAARPMEFEGVPNHRTGIGLSVVRGLVSRELRGKFTLLPAPGGTVATLSFPLMSDEMPVDPL